jgi:ABC1 atypical kinase-like domain
VLALVVGYYSEAIQHDFTSQGQTEAITRSALLASLECTDNCISVHLFSSDFEEQLPFLVKAVVRVRGHEGFAQASLQQLCAICCNRACGAGQEVAVKVQRPSALSTISKDLYVMRRGMGVYESIVKRFTAQATDYRSLLSTFAGVCLSSSPSPRCNVPVPIDRFFR